MIGHDIARQFKRNTRYMGSQLAGIDHAASLRQPGSGVNCLNWTVGHIVQYRGTVGRVVGVELPSTVGLDRYVQESDPIVEDGPGVVDFAELRDRLAATEDPLVDRMSSMADDRFHQEIESREQTMTRLARVLFLYFHDTLHVGQADIIAGLVRSAD